MKHPLALLVAAGSVATLALSLPLTVMAALWGSAATLRTVSRLTDDHLVVRDQP